MNSVLCTINQRHVVESFHQPQGRMKCFRLVSTEIWQYFLWNYTSNSKSSQGWGVSWEKSVSFVMEIPESIRVLLWSQKHLHSQLMAFDFLSCHQLHLSFLTTPMLMNACWEGSSSGQTRAAIMNQAHMKMPPLKAISEANESQNAFVLRWELKTWKHLKRKYEIKCRKRYPKKHTTNHATKEWWVLKKGHHWFKSFHDIKLEEIKDMFSWWLNFTFNELVKWLHLRTTNCLSLCF